MEKYSRATANSFSTLTFSYGGSLASSDGNFGIVVDFVGWWSTIPQVDDGKDLCLGGHLLSTLALSKLALSVFCSLSCLSGLSGGRSGGCLNSMCLSFTWRSIPWISQTLTWRSRSLTWRSDCLSLSFGLSCLLSQMCRFVWSLCLSCRLSGLSCLSVAGLSSVCVRGSGGGAGRGRLLDWGVQARRGFSNALGSGGTCHIFMYLIRFVFLQWIFHTLHTFYWNVEARTFD